MFKFKRRRKCEQKKYEITWHPEKSLPLKQEGSGPVYIKARMCQLSSHPFSKDKAS